MEKVYCENCLYLDNSNAYYVIYECYHESNIEHKDIEGNWLTLDSFIKTFKQHPSDINKDNNCENYESK